MLLHWQFIIFGELANISCFSLLQGDKRIDLYTNDAVRASPLFYGTAFSLMPLQYSHSPVPVMM